MYQGSPGAEPRRPEISTLGASWSLHSPEAPFLAPPDRATEGSQVDPNDDDRLRNLMADDPRTCPHCDSRLDKWRVPDEATWNEEFFFVCFNDDCPYYLRGWKWMEEQYSQRASYRYALNPTSGAMLPLPVWSASATREMIVDEDEGDDK